MGKDPAFLFYSQDFYTGVSDLTFEDRGRFITILCLMHQKGRMKEETIRFLVGSISDILRLKFLIDKEGFWYNKRLEYESEKRNNFVDSRTKNGAKGGRPSKKKTIRLKVAKPKNNHIENEIDNENIDKNKKGNEIILPYSSESFKKVWAVLINQPKWKKKSQDALIASAFKLSKLDEKQAISTMLDSIEGNWQGLFLKNKSQQTNSEKPYQERMDELKERLLNGEFNDILEFSNKPGI